MIDLTEFQKELGYVFKNEEYLVNAVTHSSYTNEHTGFPSNERLEFLGDSVLGLVVADKLYSLYPNENEGVLSKIRSHIVKEESLYKLALSMNFDKYILLGNSEIISNGNHKSSIISDSFEAVLAAIYKDGGFATAYEWLKKAIPEDLYFSAKDELNDYKTTFQEYIQRDGSAKIEYKLIEETGPAHSKTFRVGVYVNGKFMAEGIDSSKKHAEQNAAKNALNLR